MPIQIVCPNGHPLKVKDSYAGKTGRCPVCKAVVHIPLPPQDNLSEDAILGILGQADPKDPRKLRPPKGVTATPPSTATPPKKSCPSCNHVISAEIHICPNCHTYIAALRDF